MGDSANAIEVSDLRKTLFRMGFSGGGNSQALKGVTFSVPKGAVFGLLGPNGAGKTTFVKIMLGIVGKTVGDASVMGHSAGSSKARNQIGYLPEHLRVRRHHTAHSALEFLWWIERLVGFPRCERNETLCWRKLAWRSGGTLRLRSFPKGCCSGSDWRKHFFMIPIFLILDEPTDGLDPQARADVREIMTALPKRREDDFSQQPHIAGGLKWSVMAVAILDHGDLKYCGSGRKK